MNFKMNFNSMDEDESASPTVLTENSEDYMETCDNEVTDIVQRFQGLNINDEPIELRSEITINPCFSEETIPRLINNNEGTLMADSSVKVSPTLMRDISCKTWTNKNTRSFKKNSVSTTNETTQAIPANIPTDKQSQDVAQKTLADVAIHMHPINQKHEQKLAESEEMKETGAENVLDESPLNLCVIQKLDDGYSTEPWSTESESKAELSFTMAAPQTTKLLDLETGEVTYTSSIILPERRSTKGNGMGQYDAIVDLYSPNLSYSADVSSDDQSLMKSGMMNDSSPDTLDSGAVKDKLYEKIAVFVSPGSQMNQIRQRRFGVVQPPSNNVVETEISETNSTSDEDSNKSNAVGKATLVNSRRRNRKIKSSSTPKFGIPPDAENIEEKRTSPCKRKKSSSESLLETTGKFRKRSISESNSETGGKTHLGIRSRSFSSGSMATNPSVEISSIRKSRKRRSSNFENVGRVKSRRSSVSSDDAENK